MASLRTLSQNSLRRLLVEILKEYKEEFMEEMVVYQHRLCIEFQSLLSIAKCLTIIKEGYNERNDQ